MSRDIKFRGKRIDSGQWVYGQYFKTPLTDENSGTTPDAGWFFLCGEPRHCIVQNVVAFVIDPETVGQYTGIKDKDGKEIYEGDILKGTRYARDKFVRFIGEVVFFRVSFTVNGVGKYNGLYGEELHGNFEVIGNIYENPEFLKNSDPTEPTQAEKG